MKPYYDDGQVTIYHGDCREIMPSVTADVMVTDPPYGLSAALNSGGKRCRIVPRSNRVVPDWDRSLDSRDAILGAWSPRPALVFASVTQPRPEGAYDRPLVWDKGEAVGMGDIRMPWRPNCEFVWIFGVGFVGRRSSSVLRYAVTPAGRVHPTEKPLPLMSDLIQKCPPGVIVDPFMGSGSTVVAARNLGRRAIGIEFEERYCEIAARRLDQGVLPLGA